MNIKHCRLPTGVMSIHDGGPYAKIISDRISPDDVRLTTMEVKLHRYALAELNTHRWLSRNAASSRAIPIAEMINRIKETPAYPIFWGKNQKGMQAAEKLDPISEKFAKSVWDMALERSIEAVELLSKKSVNLHKQTANRLIENFGFVTDVISFTSKDGVGIDNFFSQRCDPMAMPEFKAAADCIQDAFYLNEPIPIAYDDWALPYTDDRDWDDAWTMARETNINPLELMKKVSTARCARVSYLRQDVERPFLADVEMCENRLQAHNHPSPFEHVATPCKHMDVIEEIRLDNKNFFESQGLEVRCNKWGNFFGWEQYRKFQPNENRTKFIPNLPTLAHIADELREKYYGKTE